MTNRKIASIKLVSGEEIICTLLEIDKEGEFATLTFSNPLRIQLRDRRRNKAYSLEPWLCLKNDTLHCININKIITVHEVDDQNILDDYDAHYRKRLNLKPKSKSIKSSNKIGYVGNTNDFKDSLERLYNDTDSYEKPKDL
jgi:hypothetical protein